MRALLTTLAVLLVVLWILSRFPEQNSALLRPFFTPYTISVVRPVPWGNAPGGLEACMPVVVHRPWLHSDAVCR